jgi:hypothetical protein
VRAGNARRLATRVELDEATAATQRAIDSRAGRAAVEAAAEHEAEILHSYERRPEGRAELEAGI